MVLQANKTVANRLYTAAEFEQMPEFNERYELLEGKLVEKPMAKFKHGRVARLLMKAYDTFDLEEKVGQIVQEVSVFVREDYIPTPDLAFWSAARVPNFEINIAPRPDLAVEVQSPGQSLVSLQEKAQEYLKGGVPLIWIIQPDKKQVLIYQQGQDKFYTLDENGTLSGENIIPGFTMLVSALFQVKA